MSQKLEAILLFLLGPAFFPGDGVCAHQEVRGSPGCFPLVMLAVLMSSEWSRLLISSLKAEAFPLALSLRKENQLCIFSFDWIFLSNSLFCLGKASCFFMFFHFQHKNWITSTVQVMRARFLFGKSMISLR